MLIQVHAFIFIIVACKQKKLLKMPDLTKQASSLLCVLNVVNRICDHVISVDKPEVGEITRVTSLPAYQIS